MSCTLNRAIHMLALAERLVMDCETEVTRQRQIISRLDHAGIDSTGAQDLLRQLEELRLKHQASRDRLREDLLRGRNHASPKPHRLRDAVSAVRRFSDFH